MKRKAFLVLVVMFFSQLLISCWCNCEGEFYESYYREVSIEPFYRAESVTEGERITIDEDSIVSKDNFSFLLSFDIEQNEIAQLNLLNNLSDFGFTTANAFSCDCLITETYPNQVDEVRVYSIDVENDNSVDVTNNFDFQNYDDEFISINSIIDYRIEQEMSLDTLDFVLINTDNIPDSTFFKIEVILESGEVLTKETALINFTE